MNLEHQVCSLDLAKRLKELGVKQESLFWWSDELIEIDTHERSFHLTMYPASFDRRPDGVQYATKRFAAFTVAELGEMLPAYIDDAKWRLQSRKFNSGGTSVWYVTYENTIDKKFWHQFSRESEADARAKMLIYLIENKLITL